MVNAHWPLPRVVVAAPASGHGKTTVATGLLAALRRRGLTVSPHKVGPDYIDPGYHALAAGRPGRNLDPFLVGADRIAPLLRHGASVPTPADIAVVEGVMGLHDGAVGRRDYASTAHVARLIEAPVLLVLDTTAQGRSAAALTLGMAAFDPAVRIGGVILNRVGSPRHETLLRDALAEVGVPVLGAVTRAAEVAAPARHLGLVPVAERAPESVRDRHRARRAGRGHSGPRRRARPGPDRPAADRPAWDPVAAVGGPAGVERPRVALAGGPAFTFSYAETAELLTAAGADVVTVDPLRDPALPAGTRGAGDRRRLPRGVRRSAGRQHRAPRRAGRLRRADRGRVRRAALPRAVPGRRADVRSAGPDRPDDRPAHPRLPGGPRRHRLPGGRAPASRYAATSSTAPPPTRGTATRRRGAGTTPGTASSTGRVHASYLHTHWAGHPDAARRLVEACR